MKKQLLVVFLVVFSVMPAMASEGVINVRSAYGVKETADRLENILKEKNMTLFNRIRHSEGAEKVGIELRATELVIFGNPKVGTPLMQCRQGVAIDLPQKALIWQDEKGGVWISYNDPRYLQSRHKITGCEEIFGKLEKALAGMIKAAASR
jgi:uncharacterized protein (DUF302 family)